MVIVFALKVLSNKDITYNVTFDSKGGTSVSTVIVKKGEKISKPSDPIKKGYIFIEWQLNGTIYDFSLPVTSDITLEAKWKLIKENSYTVKFDSDGGTSVSNQIVNSSEKVLKPNDPTKEGYTFKEWTLDNKSFDFNTLITKNITLKATWEKNKTNNQNNNTNNNTQKEIKYERYDLDIFSISNYDYESFNGIGGNIPKYIDTGDKIVFLIYYWDWDSQDGMIDNLSYSINYGKSLKLISRPKPDGLEYVNGNATYTRPENRVSTKIGEYVFEVLDISNPQELYFEIKDFKFKTSESKYFYVDNKKTTLKTVLNADIEDFRADTLDSSIEMKPTCYYRIKNENSSFVGLKQVEKVKAGDEIYCDMSFELSYDIKYIQYHLDYGNGLELIKVYDNTDASSEIVKNKNDYTVIYDEPVALDTFSEFKFKIKDSLNNDNLNINISNIRFITDKKDLLFFSDESIKLLPEN